ncbi:AAA family ATPase [Streptomyces sp. NBC_01808]|uniref:HelD family protein n=1 Tax=Streptomyces sp. NBC_01808 TaxID=2975947 RepID=UPI002DDB8A49|nr:AAA family ATPase [Streptomyces sp. NBC_01808]WSA37416.1 AAA family ATPase [Streptomyces sp. NBC_01808]
MGITHTLAATSLADERRYHETCRAALDAMLAGADRQVVIGEHASASGADAEVLGYELRSQAKELHELPPGPLFFGRLDFADDAGQAGDHAGQHYHIGRMRITESPSAPPLVVDWRAPVSRAFYQAGPKDPQGVEIRRRFGWAPGSTGASDELTSLEDERPAAEATRGGRILTGEIERPRTGPMRDIAATIQPDQDDLVRRELGVSVCVQGAPGTGKTAVGLHRAAYLLYTYARQIQRGGLLVLGPNRTFLSYISAVLPALGETGVRQSTVGELVAGERQVRAEDGAAAAVLKHDVRMAEVLRRALYARVSADGVTEGVAIRDDSARWRVPPAELAEIVAGVRDERPPYAIGRERVRSRIVDRIQRQAERRAVTLTAAWTQRVGRARPIGAFLDATWPKVKPAEVLTALFTDAGELARAAHGILDAGEQRALLWTKPPRSFKSAKWSAADHVLLDELSGLLDRPEGYGHIVVDEAQDLSPMEARVIARRAEFGSLTVLGDLAQGTTPWAARDWPSLLAHLGRPDAEIATLTTGFRVPAAVVDLANRLLGHLDVDVPAARSLRQDGALRILPTPDVLTTTRDAVRQALDSEGSIGVIAAATDVDRVRSFLEEAGIATAGPDDLAARVTVLPATAAKGLEYDHVVAVEPAAITDAEDGPTGLRRLYVVLTRAVSRLDVVHSRPLPFPAKAA